jgi:hypothetical protein
MKPYLQADAPEFERLLSTLDDFIESQVSFHGFGFRQNNDSDQTIESIRAATLQNPSAYTYANNDYAALINQFDRDETTRLIITDGVQSDPTGGARLAAVAEALNGWVQSGGTFSILLYETTYRGQYYTDLGGPSPRYNCDDRPFLVFVLAPSSDAVDELKRLLGPKLAPDHEIRISGRDLQVRPVEEFKREGERRGLRVLRNISPLVIEGYRSVYDATIRDASGNDFNGFVPLPFEATVDLSQRPWNALGERATREFVRDLRPSLYAWKINPRAFEDTTADGTPASALTSVDLFQNSIPEPSIEEGEDESLLNVNYVIPVRRPESDARQFALLLTFAPDGSNARALVPASYSTDDDRSPDQCGRILKLQRLVGTIMLRNYTPGQVLLLADWR